MEVNITKNNSKINVKLMLLVSFLRIALDKAAVSFLVDKFLRY